MNATSPGPETPDLPRKGVGREKNPPPRPRWVNVFGIILVVLVVAFLALHLAGFVPMHG